jgi:thioredoxin-dependent peroxiredoxin
MSLFGKNIELKVGDAAPPFRVQTHEGKAFDLESRRGKWTVLYFYPKADTPGCTKQACGFRDGANDFKKLNAEIFGVSIDSVNSQAEFHKKHYMNFTLLADADAYITKAYGAKMPLIPMARRWTFLIGPDLTISHVEKGVDPVSDASNMTKIISSLQK